MAKEEMTKEAFSTAEQSERKERVKARWGILRNALLRGAQEEQQKLKHSIHRFSGYNLLERKAIGCVSSASEFEFNSLQIEETLTKYRWCDDRSHSVDENIDNLEVAVLALAASFPKGKCIRVISTIANSNEDASSTTKNSVDWLELIKERCQPSVRVWKVTEEVSQMDVDGVLCFETVNVTTLLVQETSSSTKYHTCLYDLDAKYNDDVSDSAQNINYERLSSRHLILTREPRQTRLSLDDLVSHRKNKGVDNTGNICVWDSERTLAYLLYHHIDDFFTITAHNNHDELTGASIVCNCHGNISYLHSMVFEQLPDCNNGRLSHIRIMELGTGMAGLSAVALGLRLAMNRPNNPVKLEEKRDGENDSKQIMDTKDIHITLTDGNSNGVKNNSINQYLTKLTAQLLQEKGIHSTYSDLDVKCETLLWTTDIDGDDGIKFGRTHRDQDVVLISDCVHFQNFHSALAITTLRCLRVGGSAIFCQPSRGPSLDNFFNLFSTAVSDRDGIGSSPLVLRTWVSHPIIDQKHHEARSQNSDVYDETLHLPKILVITKLRQLTEGDRMRFLAHQERYSPTKA